MDRRIINGEWFSGCISVSTFGYSFNLDKPVWHKHREKNQHYYYFIIERLACTSNSDLNSANKLYIKVNKGNKLGM